MKYKVEKGWKADYFIRNIFSRSAESFIGGLNNKLNTNVSFMYRDKSGRRPYRECMYMCRRIGNRMRVAIMQGRNGVGSIIDSDGGGH